VEISPEYFPLFSPKSYPQFKFTIKQVKVVPTKFTPIKRVDQIYCQMESVGDANKLYYLFSNTLGLPETWPPINRKTYHGGGVYTGNTWLKWITFNTKAYEMTSKPAKYYMLSVEPNGYERCLSELEKRGIPVKETGIQTTADSSGVEREWVRVSSFTETPFKEVNLGIAKYAPLAFSALTSTPEAETLDEHYRIMRGRLDAVDGGLLGVRYVKEVEVGVKDDSSMAAWQALLDPIKPVGETCWRIGKGPMVRLTGDSVNRIRSLTFRVRSIRRARMTLKALDLLGEVRDNTLTINPDVVNGLEFRITKLLL